MDNIISEIDFSIFPMEISEMNIYELISTRKSVREFQDQDIPKEIITRLLNAARLAPSASNRQEWRFIVVQNPETRQRLVEAAKGQKFIGKAPVLLVCCAETDEHMMICGQRCYPIDVAIAMDHITLCAVAEGLGTCWIGRFDDAQVKEILEIPNNIKVIGLMPVGFPQDPLPKKKNRLPLEKIVKYEKWH